MPERTPNTTAPCDCGGAGCISPRSTHIAGMTVRAGTLDAFQDLIEAATAGTLPTAAKVFIHRARIDSVDLNSVVSSTVAGFQCADPALQDGLLHVLAAVKRAMEGHDEKVPVYAQRGERVEAIKAQVKRRARQGRKR